MSKAYKVNQKSINTRNRARALAREVANGGHNQLDLSSVEFISRSVADELLKQANKYDFELNGMQGDVEGMFQVVKRGSKPTP